MLKIIMGSERAAEFTEKKFIEFPGTYFNTMKKQDWFNDAFVKQIIHDIDKAEIVTGYAVQSIDCDAGYSVNDLSGGSKALILIHLLRDRVFLATMGDNCTDLLEQIALSYEKEGLDLVIVSNYLHLFKFNYVNDIEYLNWGIVCNSTQDIFNKIESKWYDQEGGIKVDDEPTDSELELMDRAFRRIDEEENR